MLLAIEGFDFYASVGQITQRSGYLQWTSQGGGDLSIGRIDGTGKSLGITTNSLAAKASLASNIAKGYIGFALNMNGSSPIFSFTGHETNSNTDQFTLTFNGADASISYPGGRTTNNLYPINTWFYLEIGFTVSRTVGNLVVRINGITVLTLNNINTAVGSTNSWINGFSMGAHDFVTSYVDDLYICDDQVGPGPNPCNSFLGDRRIFTMIPASAGDVTGWTPNSGTNWSRVVSSDDDTTYNSTTTVGAEDLFNLTQLPASVVSVLAVQVTGRYKKLDATTHTLTQRIKAGGVDAPGVGFLAPYSLSTSYVYYSDLFPVNPATTSGWSVAAVNSAQIGYKLET